MLNSHQGLLYDMIAQMTLPSCYLVAIIKEASRMASNTKGVTFHCAFDDA